MIIPQINWRLSLAVVVCLLSISNTCSAIVGLGDWVMVTPGGHKIFGGDPYPSSETPVLEGFTDINNIQRWYYYHDHIIGIGATNYFIFNEKSETSFITTSYRAWTAEIGKRNLDPLITWWLDRSDHGGVRFVHTLFCVFCMALFGIVSGTLLRHFAESYRYWKLVWYGLTLGGTLLWLSYIYMETSI